MGCRGCPQCYDLGGKVRDHDHLVQFHNHCGCAHNKYNVIYRKDRFKFPLLANNSFRYDIQFLIAEISKFSFPEKLKPDECVPQLKPTAKSEIDYVSIEYGASYRFLDTLHFFK